MALEFKARFRTKGAERDLKRFTGIASSSAKRLAAAFGLAFSVTALVHFTKTAIKSASDLAEAWNLVQKTFGRSADEILRFSEKASSAIGQTKGESLALLGEIGSLTRGFGFTEEAAANFSLTVLALSSDIGSLKNAATDDVLRAFRSAIVGQSEPMLRFGSDTRIVTLEQIALSEGLIDTKRKLTTQEKAIASLVQVFKTNKIAIGDFKDTQKEFATASKISSAKMRELTETLGTKFLPAAVKFVVGTRIIIENLDIFKKAVNESITPDFSGTIFDTTGRVDLVSKFREMFSQIQKDAKDAATKAKESDSFFSPMLSLMARMVGVDDGSITEIKKETKSSLDELIGLIKTEMLKVEKSFNIEEGIQKAIASLSKTRELLDDQVVPAALRMSSALEFSASSAGEIALNQGIVMVRTIDAADAADRLAVSFGRSAQLVSLLANGLASAAAHGQNLLQTLQQIAKQLAVKAFTAAALSLIPGAPGFAKLFFGFEHGTNFAPGGPALVGERGPEIVNLPRGSQVIPNNQITNNSSSTVFNLSFSGFPADDFQLRKFANKLSSMVQDGELHIAASEVV